LLRVVSEEERKKFVSGPGGFTDPVGSVKLWCINLFKLPTKFDIFRPMFANDFGNYLLFPNIKKHFSLIKKKEKKKKPLFRK
jgi:hypothetical protein